MGFPTTEAALRYLSNAGQMTEVSIFGDGFPMFTDWYDRIAAGAVPPAPPRPRGRERTLVITEWDAGNEIPFIHHVASTDKRNPTLNRDGLVHGVEFHNDWLAVVDPVKNTDRLIKIPTQIDRSLIPTFTRQTGWTDPSPTWGMDVVIRDHANPNHLTQDKKGRVWITARVNVNETPAFCRAGSDNVYAQYDPIDSASRHIAMYDPRTEDWTLIQTCFRTHHVQMAVDGTNRAFANPLGAQYPYFGWIDIDTLDRTGDHEAAQGWCRLYYDADGDGDADRNFPVQGSAPYSVIQSPSDGSLWGAVSSTPGQIVRLDLGSNPPETCVGERYEVPYDATDLGGKTGFVPRGIDITTDGVVWTALAGSGHLASFDRRKCKGPLTGPEAMTGRHCPEGWTLYPSPGPRLDDSPFSADYHYYNFVDQYNGFGLGKDTPFANGTNSDSVLALDPETGEWLTFRVPYPLGFYTRGMDVRIDNPKAGWKGRGLWAVSGTRAVWHGGDSDPGDRTQLAHFQLRSDPLDG
jgi:hypothetical protein